MIFRRQTDEQREEKWAAQDARRRAEEKVRAEQKFRQSPAGRARESFENGDNLFQITLRASDPQEALNAIVDEGWRLHSFSTSQAVDSKMAQNVGLIAVTSRLVCTYVFIRRQES